MDSSTENPVQQDPFRDASRGEPSQHSDPSLMPALNPTPQQPSNDVGTANRPADMADQTERPGEGTQPITRRRAHSHYYIVFSVSGIERSNVKNPIIRFDAKVAILI